MASHSLDVNADNFDAVVLEGSHQAPVVIDFWAPWCAPCRALKPVLEKLADEYDGKFTLAKINSDENQDIAASMGVRGIPAVKAVVDGEVIDEFVGALHESQVREFIERLIPSQSAVAQKEGRDLIEAGRHAEALVLLDTALGLDARNEAAKIDRMEALLRLGRTAEARSALDDLDILSLRDAKVAALKAELEFADIGAEDAAALLQQIGANPDDMDARLRLARHQVHSRDYEAAFAQLLEIVRKDRKFGDDVGRKTMLELFNLLGSDDPRVGRYRRLLSGALY